MMKVEDFKKLAPLVNAYELQPGKHYVVVCDGRHFDFGLANALLKHVTEMHQGLEICVIATLHPKSIEVREKDEASQPIPGESET